METRCICKIRTVYRQIMKFETELEKEYGLNINEAMLLCLLTEKEALLAGEIADELDLTRSNTSKVIAAMEKKKYIRRHTCPDDSRCQRFSITPAGREVLGKIHEIPLCTGDVLS